MSDPFDPQHRRRLILREGRERSIVNRHPWIFSGAIFREEGPADAAIADLVDRSGHLLASGFYSQHSQIRLRAMSYGEPFTAAVLMTRIRSAIAARRFGAGNDTTALRLVNSEGDRVSGLVVDRYGDFLVVEITSAGLDRVRDVVAETLIAETGAAGILFANDLAARKLERLPTTSEMPGDLPDETTVRENGLFFVIALKTGQKTGFFLDQRDSRSRVQSMAAGRDVLNLFAYSGGFGVYAMAGGAASVEEVDVSAQAIELARRNHEMNSARGAVTFTVADAFEHVRRLERDGRTFDLIVCDPPAFARSRGDVERAARGYKDINMHAMRLLRPGGHLLTFSCSGHVSAELFQKIVFAAALDAGRELSIVARTGAGSDHPVSIYCPESEYLKGLVLKAEG